MNKIFTKSDKFNSEYCCSIVKIGECFPIEGKDRIQRTLVNGETIVISKAIQPGAIMFYASNETQLNSDFLAANNLIESSNYELNANAKEVEPYVLVNRQLKEKVEGLEKIMRKMQSCVNFLTAYDSEIVAAEGDADKLVELSTRYENTTVTVTKYAGAYLGGPANSAPPTANTYNLAANAKLKEVETAIVPIKEEIEKNTNFIRSNVGFFNKNGRVRAVRLGGYNSMGFLFTVNELAKWCPKVKNMYLNDLVGEDFDTVDGVEFIKAYVPYVPQRGSRADGKSRDRKRNAKIEKFDRMIKGEFSYHYSTDPLPKCISRIKPTDVVSISNKIHGTSFICGKLKVRTPIKLPIHKHLWNKFIDITGIFKSLRVPDYFVEYGNVTSSRTTIKNQYINKGVTEGYYKVDVWSEYGNLIYPYLDEGMTIYGEIFGYVTGTDGLIQKKYDYGCEVGTNKLMPYRITTTNPDGTKREWDVMEVKAWTEKLVAEHPEIADKIYVIDVHYHGTLANLYPDLSLIEHWHENVLERLRNDVEHFGMEKAEPMCKNKVPKEGVILRIDNDPIAEAYKLKTDAFRKHELKAIDAGEVDIEMINANIDA